jgi:hypothetical protein
LASMRCSGRRGRHAGRSHATWGTTTIASEGP